MKQLNILLIILIFVIFDNCKSEDSSIIQKLNYKTDDEIYNQFHKLISNNNLKYNLDSIEKLKIQAQWSKDIRLIFDITKHHSSTLYYYGLKKYARNELIKFDFEYSDKLDDTTKLQLYMGIIQSVFLQNDNRYPKDNIINNYYLNKANILVEKINSFNSYMYYYNNIIYSGVYFNDVEYDKLCNKAKFYKTSDFTIHYLKALRNREERKHIEELINMKIADKLGELPKGELGVSYRYNNQLDSAEKYLRLTFIPNSKNISNDIYIPCINLIKLFILQEKNDSVITYINYLKKFNLNKEIIPYKVEFLKICENYFNKVKNKNELIIAMNEEIEYLKSLSNDEIIQSEILNLSDINKSKIENYKNEIRKKNIYIVFTIFIVSLIVFFISIYLLKRSKKAKKEQNDLKNKVSETQAELKENIFKLSEIKNINEQRNVILNKILVDSEDIHQKINNQKLIKNLKRLGYIENEWADYKSNFDIIFPDYFDKLLNINSNLTRLDLRHASYIKLNFSTKEVAQLLNVSPQTVSTFRLRLKKKLNLDKDKSLNSFLINLK